MSTLPPDDGAEPHGDGDCYPTAFRMLMDAPDVVRAQLRLCHGRVYHPSVGWHGHAWIEVASGESVTDYSNGTAVVAPREEYYAATHASSVVRYTAVEAHARSHRWNHFGPWAA